MTRAKHVSSNPASFHPNYKYLPWGEVRPGRVPPHMQCHKHVEVSLSTQWAPLPFPVLKHQASWLHKGGAWKHGFISPSPGKGREDLQATAARLGTGWCPWSSTAQSRGKQLVLANLTQALLLICLLLVNFSLKCFWCLPLCCLICMRKSGARTTLLPPSCFQPFL